MSSSDDMSWGGGERLAACLARNDAEIAREEEERAQGEREAAHRRRLKDWERMIPARFRWCGPEAPAELVAKLRPVDAQGNPVELSRLLPRVVALRSNACFVGGAGTGKTSTAIMALRARFFEGRSRVLFVSARTLGSTRIQTAAGTGEAALVALAMRADLLLIDDVGNERQTAVNAVPDVIAERHDAMRATWITTGHAAADVERMYGAGIARRIFGDAPLFRFAAGTKGAR